MTSYANQDMTLGDPFVIRVNNGKHSPAYIRLFDPKWQKESCTIDTPEMEDPTIGKLPRYETFSQGLQEKQGPMGLISVWCPNIPMNLDLFTLHLYDSFENDDVHFQNLRIFYPVLDKYQMQGNVVEYVDDFLLSASSRLSFIMPSMSTALFYFWPKKVQ